MNRLYINGILADLYDDTEGSVLLSKSINDYHNPAILKNGYSKSIKLPSTPINDKIFNNMRQLDRNQSVSAFNPSYRTSYEYFGDLGLVDKGYIKLNKINSTLQETYYEITLYSELGDILYGLDTKIVNGEETKMTLGDLIYEESLTMDFRVPDVLNAWDSLRNDIQNKYQTINYMVAYEGVPENDEFSANKVMVKASDYPGYEYYDIPGSSYGILGNTQYNYYADGELFKGPYESIGVIEKKYSHYGALPYLVEKDDITYTTTPRGYVMIQLEEGATPLEMRNLKPYLLRPVVRVIKVLEAIERYIKANYGYSLTIPNFFRAKTIKDMWMTLHLPYQIKELVAYNSSFDQEKLFSLSPKPSEFLISLCKTFGLYLDVVQEEKLIRILQPFNFFYKTNGVGQIVKADIDESSIEITPLTFDKSNYTFNWKKGEGYFYDRYYEKYDEREYGMQKIYTGYKFNSETEEYIKNNIFKGCVEGIDQSRYFRNRFTPACMEYDGTNLGYQGATLTLFNFSGRSGVQKTNINVTKWPATKNMEIDKKGYYSNTNNWGGLNVGRNQFQFPLPQFHDDEMKPTAGENILVIFNGFGTIKSYNSTNSGWSLNNITQPLILSDEVGENYSIGEDRCYYNQKTDLVEAGITKVKVLNDIPLFQRNVYTYGSTNYINFITDFGFSKEIFIPNTEYSGTCLNIYNLRWKDQINDMYDVNTRIIKCKMKINYSISEAFKQFYWYDNCIWALYEISDFNPDNYYTDVKLIKVQNIDNYQTNLVLKLYGYSLI